MNSELNTSGSTPIHPIPEKIIRLREKIAYGTGDFASCLFFKVWSSYLMFFYTDMVGIGAATIGTMMLVTRIFDAANDPAMGIVCDRTNQPDGKFRPWIKWMAIPFAISGVLIFTVPDVGLTGKIIYAYVTYTLAMVIYTMINIPYGALMGVMTPHSAERTDLASFRFIGAYAANMVVQATILYMVIAFNGVDDPEAHTQQGYVSAVAVFAVASLLFWTWVYRGTKERVEPPKKQDSNLLRDLGELIKNKPWVAIVVMGVSTILWIAVRDAAILYYFKYYVVGEVEDSGRFTKLATLFGVIGTVATMAGVFLTKWFTDMFRGKKNAYIWLTILTAIVACSFYFAGPGDVIMIFVIHVAVSFISGPLMPLFWAMIADTADYSEWKTGRRFTGLIFSAGTFSQKAGWAIGPAIAGYLLTYYGYVENVAQQAETIEGLRMMISFIPSGLGIIAAGLAMSYGINRKLEQQIERELTVRKAAEGTLET